jgi:hypothetical protein
MDLCARRVLSLRVSMTLEADFCIEAVGGGVGRAWQARDIQRG